MTIIRTRTILWTASASLVCFTMIGAGSLLLSSLDISEPTRLPVVIDDRNESSSTASTIPTLASFESLWNLPTDRPPSSAPKPKPMTTADTITPVLSVQLVGTIIETGKSMGMFSNQTGGVEIRAVGENVGEGPMAAKILSVSAESAELQYQGKKVVLKMPKREDG